MSFLPSARNTFHSRPPWTTWLLVKRYPSGEMKNPEPEPPAASLPCTSMCTTAGWAVATAFAMTARREQ